MTPTASAAGRHLYEYALLRAVPRVERGECLNIGVVLYCHALDYLRAAVHVDDDRLRALAPDADAGALREAVQAYVRACEGDGPAGQTSLGQRFRWLTAPRSTVVQPGPVHTGLTADPGADLERLLDALVR